MKLWYDVWAGIQHLVNKYSRLFLNFMQQKSCLGEVGLATVMEEQVVFLGNTYVGDVYGGSTKLSPELRRRRSVDVVISFLRCL